MVSPARQSPEMGCHRLTHKGRIRVYDQLSDVVPAENSGSESV